MTEIEELRAEVAQLRERTIEQERLRAEVAQLRERTIEQRERIEEMVSEWEEESRTNDNLRDSWIFTEMG